MHEVSTPVAYYSVCHISHARLVGMVGESVGVGIPNRVGICHIVCRATSYKDSLLPAIPLRVDATLGVYLMWFGIVGICRSFHRILAKSVYRSR
jgi:hypothetical protein